jgi:hypothetical protein
MRIELNAARRQLFQGESVALRRARSLAPRKCELQLYDMDRVKLTL